jgi:hypothetical protein
LFCRLGFHHITSHPDIGLSAMGTFVILHRPKY